MDFLNLGFPAETFEAGYALNCLLHVPNSDLPVVLGALRAVLAPGALLFAGMYGGRSFEGVLPNDWHAPPRFFSLRSDQELLLMVAPYLELVEFHVVTDEDVRFQALTLRRPGSTAV
jgi:hypothetical protein